MLVKALISVSLCVCVQLLQEKQLTLAAGWAGEAPGSNLAPAEGGEPFVVPKSAGFLPLTA